MPSTEYSTSYLASLVSIIETLAGSEVIVMADPFSRKSYTALESLSRGLIYPSNLGITVPNESTSTGDVPRIPSPSPSVKPASVTSRHPSPSESRSKELGIPSESTSPSPSSTSKIPSLSSSKSSISGILSLSLSGRQFSTALLQ